MNPRLLFLLVFLGATSGILCAQDAAPVLNINAGKITAKFSPMLYGLMTEEINYSYDGGLYAEQIRNRTFRDNSNNAIHWQLIGDADGNSLAIDNSEAMNNVLTRSLKVRIARADKTHPVGIANEGFWGVPVESNTKYRASFYAKAAPGFSGPLTVSLVNATNHTTVHATAQVSRVSAKWQKYEVTLSTGKVTSSKDNLLMISTTSPGTIWFNLVSLFPPTFNNRPNGNRSDLMKLLADMKPAFLRFPGGNYLEGNSFATRYNWKTTIGDISQRPGHFDDAWGYWSSDGVGLLEFLEWCEDLHMEPVLAVYGGYSMRGGAVNLETELDPCVQDALDEIEYVTGDKSTKWGARRIKDGHREAFKLQYVEVGNEDNLGSGGRTYDTRFTKFYDAIKAKYPKLKVISTCPFTTDIVKTRVPDVVDDHFYNTPLQMQGRASQYDDARYRRPNAPKVFVGEYASQTAAPNRQVTPCLGDAIGDAAFLTGLERNSDVVIMASYAPLLVNVSNPQASRGDPNRSMQWATDLVGYNASASFGSPSYYAQSIFSQNHGDEVLSTSTENFPQQDGPPRGARRGGADNEPPARPPQIPSVFYSVSRDSKTGAIFVKVVNAVGRAQPLRINIYGAANVAADGKQIVIAGDGPLATNTINDPKNIVPVTSDIHGLGKDFTREFPPYSITVLLLKSK